MAYTTVNKPSATAFNTKLYTGNGGTQSITGVGFQPDFVWFKTRSSTSSMLQDAVRGTGNFLESNNSAAAQSSSDGISSFNSDGYAIGGNGRLNSNGTSMVSWNWKAGTTSGIATNGSTNITPSGYSFNQTTGFSAIAYTGTAVDGAYLPHGLGKVPELLLLKSISLAESWQVYSAPTGNQGRGHLDASDAFDTGRGEWYSNTPDSVNMRISNDSHINASGATYIAYFFTSIQGYSKIGSYTGNGNAEGAFVYTGFKPAFVMIKRTDSSDNWNIFDNKRAGYNFANYRLFANSTSGEETSSSAQRIDIVSNGFKQRSNETDTNGNGNPHIYMAFAEAPFVGSNNVPANAR